MSALSRLLLVAALGASVLGAPAAVAAGSDASRVHDARAHYEQAVSYYNLDEFAPALAEFREAYRLKPDPSFLFNIAQCHRKLGELDAALDFYRKYLRSLPDAPNRQDVERMIADLRSRQETPAVPPPVPPVAPLGEAPKPVVAAPPLATPADVASAPRADLVATPPPPTPVYRRWWFWTTLGVLVAGAAVGTYAATRPAPQAYQGTLDPHTLEVR